MARVFIIFFTMMVSLPVLTSAQERAPQGINVCAEENPGDLTARNACYDDWRRSALLVRRYFDTYVTDEARGGFSEAFWDSFKSNIFRNPYALNRFNLFGNCSAGQVFSGNVWDDQYDFRQVWACIAKHDEEAAKWDMI